ncbi:hypothetical protein [Taibaiella chishuiensis]|uniref:Uncharacterized protein n=1 Tax=Taibaiella chishuiensis TaxID=1434707 RepID=A0A2P8D2X6_9BACT|nr:hypothetical protein [Taibaiella chishuiensis]PSK91555.1 hypothetical protein B0I18_105138 [Taibaiella chishuiensis]
MNKNLQISAVPLVIASCSQIMQHGIHLILGKLAGSIKIKAAKNDEELINVMGNGTTGMLITDGTLPYLCDRGLEPAIQPAPPWLKVAIYRKAKNSQNEDYYCLTSKLVYLESASGITAFLDAITTMLVYLKNPLQEASGCRRSELSAYHPISFSL